MENQYDQIADLYDELIPEPRGIFEFYSDFAKPGDHVLDLGCGTGRLSFVLAEKGVDVIGVDISPRMIDKAREKLGKDFYTSLKFLVSSASDFKSEKKFDLIIMSGEAFEYLLTQEQQRLTLRNINLLLKSEGVFVFDTFTPSVLLSYSNRKSDATGGYVKGNKFKDSKIISDTKVEIDGYNQLQKYRMNFDIYDKNKKNFDRKEYRFITKFTLPLEMKLLLEVEGFNIENFYGNYDKCPFDKESEFMIYECRKRVDIRNE